MNISVWLFALGCAFVLYTLIGYPVLLWVLARRHGRQNTKHFQPRSVTVLLPVHNGEKWLESKLQSLVNLDYPPELLDVLVISDSSTDGTDQIASRFSEKSLAHRVQLLRVAKGGKALALNHGMERATGEILFFTDVRQPLDSQCLRNLVSCFHDPNTGGVCGELVILDGETQEETSVGLYWKLEKWIRRQLSATGSLLVVTGCVYAIRRSLAEPLPPGALGDDIYTPQALLRKGARVVFEPSAKAYDYPTALDMEFQRKVRTLAGLYQYVLQLGLGPHPFHFFSYKVSRLLLPYALLLIAVSSPFLGLPFSLLACGGQIVIYGLAALDPWIPDRFPLKRISSPARTFCTLMLASLKAASILFVPASSLWKTTHVRQPKTPTV